MSKIELGKVAPTYIGSYETDTTYNELDIVEFNGSSYIAHKSVTGVTPGTDDTSWGLIANQGIKGDKGDQGPKGDRGPQGSMGPTGDIGPKGDKGDQGPKGDQGDQGPIGPQGSMGPAGKDALTKDNDIDIKTISKFDSISSTAYWVTTIPTTDKKGNKVTLKQGFGQNVYNGTQITAGDFNNENKSAVFVSNASPTYKGNVIQNGKVLRDESLPGKETLVFKQDGSLDSYPVGTKASDIVSDGAISGWTGFFTLIKNGEVYDYPSVSRQVTNPNESYEYLSQNHPRKIIGQKLNGDYVVITTDGRKNSSKGLTLEDSVRISQDEELNFAFNLDGGGSTNTIVKGSRVGGLFDKGGTTERVNANFIYIDIEDSPYNFNLEEYQAETSGINAYLNTKYNLGNTINYLINQEIKPSYIPITNNFKIYDLSPQFRSVNGQVSILGRIIINPDIGDTSTIYGKNFPIATNIDLGLNNPSDVIFTGFTSGRNGSGGFIRLVYEKATKNIYIYENSDKVGSLIINIYTTLPKFI